MSDLSDLNEEDPAMLEEGDNEEDVKLDEDDEMLLLSSPSSVREGGVPLKEADVREHGAETDGAELLTSSENIVVEDSELEEGSENTNDSVEVIDSEDDEDGLESEGEEEEEEEEEEDIENVDSSSAYLDGKVQIFLVHGSLFIWNADDVRMLREECRIIGKLTGCLPRAPRQNSQLGLPLQLMPEEAKLLEEIEAACVVEELEVNDEDERLRRTAFEQSRLENFKIQQKLYKESRKEEIVLHMDEIVAGKKAKKRKLQELAKAGKAKTKKIPSETKPTSAERLDQVSDSKNGNDDHGNVGTSDLQYKQDGENSSEEMKDNGDGHQKDDKEEGGNEDGRERHPADDKDAMAGAGDSSDDSEVETPNVDEMVTTETDVKHGFVQLFTENPWHRDVTRCKHWIFPLSQKDRLRYAVYRDLWRKGYYLTSGSKFGGDFLVYPGDPARYHSHYVAVCVDVSEDMSVLDLVSMARLASNVRKTALICSFNKFRQVSYFSMQWTGMV